MTTDQLAAINRALSTADDLIYRADRDPRLSSNGVTTATLQALLSAITIIRDILKQEA